jgi:hypothetical protein
MSVDTPAQPMTPADTLRALLSGPPITTERALAFFDELAVVDLTSMRGRWRGAGLPTGHPMDGLLEATGWFGKEFIDVEHVHPLLFQDRHGRVFSVRPLHVLMSLAQLLPFARFHRLSVPLAKVCNGLLRTTSSQARLRMTACRGRISATMIYDHLPTHDVFRRVDDDTVLGLMDAKGMAYPFFFILRRERPAR